MTPKDFASKIRDNLTTSGVWFRLIGWRSLSRVDWMTSLHRGIYASEEYLRIYGYPSIDKMPPRRIDVVHKDDRMRVAHAVNAVARSWWREKQFPPAQEITFRIHSGGAHRARWVHARIQGDMVGGCPAITSLDTLLEDITEDPYLRRLRFYQTVVDELQGFVFVKERVVLDDGNIGFVMRFANKYLLNSFGQRSLNDILGKTDAQCLKELGAQRPENLIEIQSWHNADEKAFQMKLGDRLIVREESFTQLNGIKLYLTTVKMPFETEMFNAQGVKTKYVLGIAFDTTGFSDLVRKAICDAVDPIFVKDTDGHYLVVSEGFKRNLLGIEPELSVEGLTFADFVNLYVKGRHPGKDLGELMAEVAAEDDRIARSGKPETVVREAFFVDGRMWSTNKSPIFGADGTVTHILGIAREIRDWRPIEERMWDQVPVSICIKNSEFVVVRCNKTYALRHDYDSPKDLCRAVARAKLDPKWQSSDHFFWGKIPDQADKYHRDDIAVLQEAVAWERAGSPLPAPWDNDDWRYVDYVELQINHHGERKQLQTTKWPEKIEGEWHVVVVYSDVTPGIAALSTYHGYTVHAIKHDLLKLEKARKEIAKLLESTGNIKHDALEYAQLWLKRGQTGLEFYLQELSKFLKGEFSFVASSIAEIQDIISFEVWIFGELNPQHEILPTFHVMPDAPECTVRIDRVFFAEAVKELLLNASAAIYLRTIQANYVGAVHVFLEIIRSDCNWLRLYICDDGVASVDEKRRAMLDEFWCEVVKGEAHLRGHRGLSYVRWVMTEHGGEMKLLQSGECPEVVAKTIGEKPLTILSLDMPMRTS